MNLTTFGFDMDTVSMPSTLLSETTTKLSPLMEACVKQYEHIQVPMGSIYCDAVHDTYLCWPPTLAGTYANQSCPAVRLSDTKKMVMKKCNIFGFWDGKEPNETSSNVGWTNYTPCVAPEIQQLFNKLNVGDSGDKKMEIAARTRQLEICGFSISLLALLLSLTIFCRFRSLKNNRTRIHKNLFMAMVVQVMIRLTLYIDQALLRGNESDGDIKGIDNTPYLCEASYVLLEYARTAMFMWMFVEGLYLHNMVTVTVFQERQYYLLYYAMGWGFPVILTAIWAVINALHFEGQMACWWGYSLIGYYWILEGPRLAVILLNFIFLMNIIRVLVMKLRQSHTSEVEQVRKAVRAAVVLLPLLGITNLLHMTQAPLEKTALEFALWSYTTHFLTSFQGFFIALLYCFFNGEVRTAIQKRISLYIDLREQHAQYRRSSAFHFISSEANNHRDSLPSSQSKAFRWCRGKKCCKQEAVETPQPEVSIPETQV
ncbi:pigment-dispersing factor receptor isoform X2 [Arctopsyche grandis]|uniref:pigment-dispersing factor receptor isoform X1 n=1 Tax=Arctopsyche grandis TaxID=121162 RepID=UPI00406DA3DB